MTVTFIVPDPPEDAIAPVIQANGGVPVYCDVGIQNELQAPPPTPVATPAQVANDGGYLISILATVEAIPAGTYVVHIGPLGTAADPIAFNGDPGSGGTEVIFVASGGNTSAQVWVPPLPIGGPYVAHLVGVSPTASVTTGAFLTVQTHPFRGGIFAYRKALPNHWKRGAVNITRERFPQT